MEICDFINNSSKYLKMGARLPKGLLISGKSGVGKTLFVKAIVNATNVPMYELSKKDILDENKCINEIRELFKVAKEN